MAKFSRFTRPFSLSRMAKRVVYVQRALFLRFGFRTVSVAALISLCFIAKSFLLWGDFPPPSFSRPSANPISSFDSTALGANLHHVEPDKPDPSIYGTSTERCFALGSNHPTGKSGAWHMNSRALCSIDAPVCLSGAHLEHVTTFEPRGAGTCDVVSIARNSVAGRADRLGLNESCAAYRRRHVIGIYGDESFNEWKSFVGNFTAQTVEEALPQEPGSDARYRRLPGIAPAVWNSDFAIIVPKYPWSWNICHYNRIWTYVMYIIRNLHLYAPRSVLGVKHVDVLFRSGLKYDGNWPRGLREATLSTLEAETGVKIRVGKIRWDPRRKFQCIKRAILLGDEGRVDAFPFLNDTNIWNATNRANDDHWPTIPQESLWLRHTVYKSLGLDSGLTYTGPGTSNFRTIPLPPKRIVYLLRNSRSPRRLTTSGRVWFENTLQKLGSDYEFEVTHLKFHKEMSFGDQVKAIHNAGVAVGLHGANMVNTMFMPAGGAMFEIFPWRYVRYYYAGGLNSGLRYSFHEPLSGIDKHCSFDKWCFMRYRESVIYLTHKDRIEVAKRIENILKYISQLHTAFPTGSIPLERDGTVYRIPRPDAASKNNP